MTIRVRRLDMYAHSAYNKRMQYEWDEAKREENLRKHGVDFADAIGALDDPRNLTLEDDAAEGEPRYRTLGMDVKLRILLVVWTERALDSSASFPRDLPAPAKRGTTRSKSP